MQLREHYIVKMIKKKNFCSVSYWNLLVHNSFGYWVFILKWKKRKPNKNVPCSVFVQIVKNAKQQQQQKNCKLIFFNVHVNKYLK